MSNVVADTGVGALICAVHQRRKLQLGGALFLDLQLEVIRLFDRCKVLSTGNWIEVHLMQIGSSNLMPRSRKRSACRLEHCSVEALGLWMPINNEYFHERLP